MNFAKLNRRPADAADWIPAVDIAETDDRFVLTADLPGVSPDDIEISLEDNVLTLAGRRADVEAEGRRRHYAERRNGRFLRRFTLPATIDGDRIEARSAYGTLEITVPKRAEVQPRRIEVAAA